VVSYYDKGRWAALVLDLMLRTATSGRRGLPDLFARLWRTHGAKNRGIETVIVQRAAEAMCGRSLAGYFRRFIDGTAEMPVAKLLRGVGVKVEAKAAYESSDPVKSRRLRAWCGLAFAANGDVDKAVVKNVVPDSPAWRAGITFGDEVVAVDGVRVTAATVNKRLSDHAPGQAAVVTFFRKDRLTTATVRLANNPERKWCFAVDPEASTRIRRLRALWLGIKD